MFKLLEIENFLPFRNRTSLPLDNQGLILLRGDNRVSASANNNGAGKTSIGHAICWGLFGVDLLDRRADDVCNRFTKGQTVVRIVCEDALGEWSVERCRRPISLKVTGIDGVLENEDAKVIQQKIEQRLGFGLRTFRNAVIFGQGAFDRYTNADQDEQLRMLDEIQGIDFSAALKRAKEWRAGLMEKRASLINNQVLTLTTKCDEHRRIIKEQERVRDSFQAVQEEAVKRLEQRRPALEQAVAQADEAVTAIQSIAARLPDIEGVDRYIDILAEEVRRAQEAEYENSVAREALTEEINALQEQLDNLGTRSNCPACLQPVSKKIVGPLLRKAISAKAKQFAKLTKLHNDIVALVARKEEDRVLEVAKLAELTPDRPATIPAHSPRNFVPMLRDRCGELRRKQADDARKNARRALSRLDEDLTDQRNRKWEGEGALQGRLAMLRTCEQELAAVEAKGEKLNTAIRITDYWIEAFGDRGLRSLLVDSVAGFMNERIAWHLETLAGGEAKCVMSATTPTKKGTTRERISFSTTWDWGVAGGDGSGGQDRRKDLAVFAAAQDLAESCSARPFPIKIFDEPFDALDSRGKELACEWVRKVAQAQGTALLITHAEDVAAVVEADRIWTVVLDQDGARVEVS